jgi:hypothetical protein
MSNNTSTSSGISFTGLLTLLFITLKLTRDIAWSWWWVLSPIWIGAIAVIAICLVVIVVTAIAAAVKG